MVLGRIYVFFFVFFVCICFFVCLLCVCLFVYYVICFVLEDIDVIFLFVNCCDICCIKLGLEFLVYGQVVIDQIGVVVIDYDYDMGFIYWIDVVLGNIQCVLFDDLRIVEVVVRGLKFFEGLVVDWINKKLYWIDVGVDVIEVVEFNG